MLANAQNVEIGCSAPKSEALPMDQVSYYLILNIQQNDFKFIKIYLDLSKTLFNRYIVCMR